MRFYEAYNPLRAAQLARICALVKKDQVEVKRLLHGEGAILRSWFEHRNGTQGALISMQGINVLAFRATEVRMDRPWESLKDIRTDLMFRPVPYRGAMVHRGFLGAYKSVENTVETALTYAEGDRPLFITGHSLGGALAKIAGMSISDRRVAGVYTFGAPRVGNGKVDPAIGAPLYQFIHAGDIVPRVPLLSFGYRSAGDRRFITRKGIIRRGTGFQSALRFFLTWFTPTRLVTDHDLDRCYRPPIEKAAVQK